MARPKPKSNINPVPKLSASTALSAVMIIAVISVLWFVARSGKTATDQTGTIKVAAAENFWGSLAAQLGGNRVNVTSIINNPDTDPHSYEPTAKDSRTVADAQYAIVNGVGYDSWADKLLAANLASGKVLKIGELVGAAPGDNPHRWYSPENVQQVISQITADYKTLDPTHAAYFDQQKIAYETIKLKQYNALISEIKTQYTGVSVGASESIFTPLAQSLGLNLLTPPSFLAAMSEGADPTAADKSTADQQITSRQIKMYVYNSQNATPDIARQIGEARVAGIPVVTITETLVPTDANFQDWQTSQLKSLRTALAKATGK